MSDLSSLIARLEKAEQPSRDLDVEIMNTVDPRSPDEKRLFDGKVYPATWGAVGQLCDQIRYFVEAPFLTSSIDAAVSLAERVLPGWRYAIERRTGGMCLAWVTEEDDAPCIPAMHPHSAMALVLSTLRALQQKGSSNE